MTKQNKQSTDAAVRDIRCRTRRKFSPGEKIQIVLEGLRGEQSVSNLCRRGGRFVRRTTFEKMEIIRLVEGADKPPPHCCLQAKLF
ncbi:MAG TPA: hypothetical protein EYG46_05130 [Myxococcales bacterium]|nr:hypothetical protein [Myxococcales bacterium]HIM00363.1 hypothetical protein [Myxococcales bacterium]